MDTLFRSKPTACDSSSESKQHFFRNVNGLPAELQRHSAPSENGYSGNGEFRKSKFLNRLAWLLSFYAFVGGSLTLIGWFSNLPRLTDWGNSTISMYVNTALATVFSSLAILLRLKPPTWSRTVSRTLGVFVMVLGTMTLFEHISGVNLGIDTLLLNQPWGGRAAVSPGRMGPPASTSFMLLGLAQVVASGTSRTRRAVPTLGILVVAISLLSLIGYLFDADPLYAVAQFTGIAMQTATMILALGLALLASVPELRPMATLCGDTAASALARRALPFVFLLPITLGWIFIRGREAGFFDRGMGTAMLVLALVAFFCGLVWWCVADVAQHERRYQLAEQELRHKNKQLAGFLETAAVGLHRVGPDGTIQWANTAEMEMLGYTPEEYVGRHIAEFHADKSAITDILSRLTYGEKLHEYEARLRCKDGSIKHVLIDSSGLWEDGQFLHTQCFTKDITEKKRAEVALRASEELYRATFENAAVGIAHVSLDGRWMCFNSAVCVITGYSSEELTQKTFADITHPGDIDHDWQQARLLIAGETTRYTVEKRYIRKDSSIVWVMLTVSLLRDTSGTPLHFISIIENIDERKRAQEKVARLATIVEESDDAIISKNLDGIIQSWNKGAERIFGYTAEEIIGRSITTLIPRDRLDEEPGILARVRNGDHIEHYETVRRRKDGTLLDVSVSISPIRDAQGRVVGISKVGRDITEKVRSRQILEQTVAERTASLREALVQMEEFSYSVSHDLRAPLRAMNAYAGVLMEEYGERLDNTGRSYVEKIQRASDRMNRLTEDVLAYSRVARSQVQPEAINFEGLVRDVINQYANLQPPAADIEIVGPLLNVLGHETTLGQVVSNLLNNAVKFVAAGVKPHVRIRTERIDKDVRVWFEDNGIGINREYQERIFQMFERIHPEGKYEGTGIGLTIVRKAMEKMGGQVGVESDGRNGSRFWIELGHVER